MNPNGQKVLSEVYSFIKANSGNPTDYYIGVSDTPAMALKEHQVKFHKNGSSIIGENTVAAFWGLQSEHDALEIKAFFLGLGVHGQMGVAPSPNINVFVYRITPQTVQ